MGVGLNHPSATGPLGAAVGGAAVSGAVGIGLGTAGSPQGKGVQQQQSLPSTSGNSGTGGLQAPTAGMPTAADFSLMLSLGLGLNPADPNQLANIDLQKLAMYLVSIVHIPNVIFASPFFAFRWGLFSVVVLNCSNYVRKEKGRFYGEDYFQHRSGK